MGTASALPERSVTTAEVAARAVPDRDPRAIEAKIGIRSRRWAEPGALASDLATAALRGAVEAAGLEVGDLRRVILVSSTSGDAFVPATANAVIHALGIDNRCDGFDVSNACMGFLSAFDIGARAAATGCHPIGIVAVELMSRFIRPEDPRPYLVFGDAAAATVLGPGRPGEGVLGIALGNDGSIRETAYIEHPSLTGKVEYARFGVPSGDMSRIVTQAISRSAAAALAQCGEQLGDVEWVLPHQPNGSMLETIVKTLGVDPARVVPVVQDAGSVLSASIPLSLDRLMRTRPVRPGHRILMIGVGSGLAYGAILYRVAP